VLDASHPVGGEVKDLAHHSLCSRLAPIDAIAQREDPSFSFGEKPKDELDMATEHRLGNQVDR